MNCRLRRRIVTTFVLCMLIFCSVGYAENIDPDNDGSQYAWGENVGWINFEPLRGPGVDVSDTSVTGYAWGENIGWINLSPATGGVINDGAGNLSGYAWGENIGWINFAPTGGGVFINSTTGAFSGYAWGENIGWINFAPNGVSIKTSWRGQDRITVLTIPTRLWRSDTDTDGDGLADCVDNSTSVHNPDQADSNGNGTGNAYEDGTSKTRTTQSLATILSPSIHAPLDIFKFSGTKGETVTHYYA